MSKMIETHDIPRAGEQGCAAAPATALMAPRPQLAAALTALFGPLEAGMPEMSGYIIATG